MVEQLPGYEGVATLEIVVQQRNLGDIIYVYDRDIRSVQPGVYPYHPMFWYLFAPKSVQVSSTGIMVVWLSSFLGTRV